MNHTIRQLTSGDAALFDAMLALFGEVFEDPDTYGSARPGPAYVERLLASNGFISLVALEESRVVGALAAYVMEKFEQERSEIYIYDLAVLATHRRRGIATGLIAEVQRIAAERGAWVVMVQADHGDDPAIALYSKLGSREEVLHFDLPVPPQGSRAFGKPPQASS